MFALAVHGGALSAASAQTPEDEKAKAAARELANKGYELYEAGEYAKAIPLFRDAEARFHAPSILIMQANSHVKLGQLVEAMPLYQRVADEPLGDNPPKEFVDAQAEAKAALDGLKPRIATLKIALKGMTPDRVRVTIDDVEVPAERLLEPIPQNPGTHKVVAAIGGEDKGRAVFQSVTLKEGMTKQIQLVFRPGQPPPPPPSGGCASCEIAGARADGVAEGLLSMVAVGLFLAARRRRSVA